MWRAFDFLEVQLVEGGSFSTGLATHNMRKSRSETNQPKRKEWADPNHTSQYSWLQSMHCQNSKFLSNRQLGILWKPFAASTASSVDRGFWMNLPLHLVHLDIKSSSAITNWNASITCRTFLRSACLDLMKITVTRLDNWYKCQLIGPIWLHWHWNSCMHTSSSCSFFNRLFILYIWFCNKYSCLNNLASRVRRTLFSLCACAISSLQ